MPKIFIETSRLILRQWQRRDDEPFIRLNADPQVMEFFPAIKTPEETRTQIDRLSAYIDKHGYGFFAVERKDNHRFIGFTGITQPGFEAHFTPCIEIGWRLSKENWGHGFAAEAARACVDFGFNAVKVKEIYSFTSIENQRSQRVMQRIGMEKEGEFAHPMIAHGHQLSKHVLYKIIAPDELIKL